MRKEVAILTLEKNCKNYIFGQIIKILVSLKKYFSLKILIFIKLNIKDSKYLDKCKFTC